MLTLFAHAILAVAQLPLRYLGLVSPWQVPDAENYALVGHYGVHEEGIGPWDE